MNKLIEQLRYFAYDSNASYFDLADYEAKLLVDSIDKIKYWAFEGEDVDDIILSIREIFQEEEK